MSAVIFLHVMHPTTIEQMLDRDTNGYFREFMFSKDVVRIEALSPDRADMKGYMPSGAPITYKQLGVSHYIDLLDFISELYRLADRPFKVQFEMIGDRLGYELEYL